MTRLFISRAYKEERSRAIARGPLCPLSRLREAYIRAMAAQFAQWAITPLAEAIAPVALLLAAWVLS